jgi:hypothetical protein
MLPYMKRMPDIGLPPKRLSITVASRHMHTVVELGEDGALRQALQEWYAQRGEQVDLGSESARLRALLDVADFTIRSWALEVGYEHMATWHNERTGAERPAWQQRRARSARQWAEEEAATDEAARA